MNEAQNIDRVGEVIEACSTDFVAQCYELYQSPPLGCLVKTRVYPGNGPVPANLSRNKNSQETGIIPESLEVYGVVCKVLTAGEEGRRPIARGKNEPNEDEIYRSSPQLLKLLKSEFNVLVIGYKETGRVFQHLPPKPARIHGFVHQCSPEEVKEFSRYFDFLNLMLKARLEIPVEELVGASLREMSRVYGIEKKAFLVSAGKELATLLTADYIQLKAILKGLKHDAIQ